MDNSKPKKNPKYIEIDIVSLIMNIWEKRRLIVKATCCFFILGIFVALVMPRKYTATRVFITQSNSSTGKAGSLSSLASLAGINLGDELQDGPMSPLVYPQILSNVEFQKELMMTPITFKGIDGDVSFYDYYTDPQYDKHPFLTGLKKYTIGLPGTLMKLMRGDEDLKNNSLGNGSRILSMTRKEAEVAKELKERVSLTVDKKEGFITISSTMPEALAAAQLNEALFSLLRKYVSEFKINKSQKYLDYIQMEYDQAKKDYENIQVQYAAFRDANRGVKTAVAEVEAERLASEVALNQQLYTSLANNLLAAKVKVNEENVVFTDISPVSVPDKAANSRSKTVLGWTFLGFILACGWVLVQHILKEQLVNFRKKEEDSNTNI